VKGQTKYEKEIVENAVQNARSLREAIENLGLKPNNGNYRFISAKVRLYGISIEHFVRHATRGCTAHNSQAIRNVRNQLRWTDDELFRKSSVYVSGSRLRKRLLEKGWEYKCAICGHDPIWNGKKLTLQVDHINGDSIDNRLENLRFLCPNCHSQTATFGNNKNRATKPEKTCNICGRPVHYKNKSGRCRGCSNRLSGCQRRGQNTKIKWPPHARLLKMVEKTSFSAVGRKLGVSDNAVRKHLKI